jgi:hypothetical protein
MQRAARHDSIKLLTEIVRLCFDVHCPGPALGDCSALQLAAARCDEEGFRIMQSLIEEQSADVNEPRAEEAGYTSLEAACHVTVQIDNESNTIASRFLLEKGAAITPFTLHVAVAWNHTKLVQCMLEMERAIRT